MNFFSLLGFVLAGLVFTFGVMTTTSDPSKFIDMHAILIVVGGSIAATSIAFQLDRLAVLFRVFLRRVLGGRKTDYVTVITDLMRLADAYRGNGDFEKLVKSSPEPFLKEAFQIAMENVLDRERLVKVLRNRVSTQYHRYQDEATKFKTVGKYPPAFGLMGTTLGMISLLQKLGEPGSQKMIGPSMSVALVATFYGITLTNLVFGPIAENLMDSAKETRLKHTIIVEGVILILEKTNPIVLAEELNSYLLPQERVDWRKAAQSGGASAASGKAA